MSAKTPEDRILEWATSRISEYMNQLIHDDGPGASPIEKILFAAVYAKMNYSPFENRIAYLVDGQLGEGSDPRPRDSFLFGQQVDVLKNGWKVDFTFTIRDEYSPRLCHLVVECDGHDFHERTKEQAKRDRMRDRQLQEAGFTIFRFTGSEIWNDPMGCATTVVDWCSERYWDYQFEHINRAGRTPRIPGDKH